MDFSQYQPVAPPAFQPVPAPPKEKSYIHQPVGGQRDLHAPLSISIPSGHLEHPRIPKTATHPALSGSAFKAWEPAARHVHRQVSAPGHTSTSSSTRRHAHPHQRRQSIEDLPGLFGQPYGGAYGGSAQQHPPQPSYYHQIRQKSISTHSATEVTV